MMKQSQGSGGPGVRKASLRLHGTIARDLGIKIVSGFYQPGYVLDGEVAASGVFEVSRTAYREGVRILAAKGLVESRPKTGTRVSERHRWHLLDPDVLSWIFEHEPDERLIVSLFELRNIVEPQAAAFAASRRTDAQLKMMADALEGMARYSLATEEGRAADKAFHSALLEASDNPFLVSLTSSVGAAVAWTTVYKQRVTPLRRDPVPDHQRVYDAVLAGDSVAAREAMETLVDLAFIDTANAGRRPPTRNRTS